MPSPWEHPSPSSGRRYTHLLGGLLACRSLLLASRGSPLGLVGSGAVVAVLGACGRAGGGAGFFSSFSLSCGTQGAQTHLGRPQPCRPTSGHGHHTHTPTHFTHTPRALHTHTHTSHPPTYHTPPHTHSTHPHTPYGLHTHPHTTRTSHTPTHKHARPLCPDLRHCFLQTPPHTKHHPASSSKAGEGGRWGHRESSGGEPTSQATLLQ